MFHAYNHVQKAKSEMHDTESHPSQKKKPRSFLRLSPLPMRLT